MCYFLLSSLTRSIARKQVSTVLVVELCTVDHNSFLLGRRLGDGSDWRRVERYLLRVIHFIIEGVHVCNPCKMWKSVFFFNSLVVVFLGAGSPSFIDGGKLDRVIPEFHSVHHFQVAGKLCDSLRGKKLRNPKKTSLSFTSEDL